MSLHLYLKFDEILTENGLEGGKLSVSETLAIAEDIILSESVPERISEKLTELYGESSEKLISCVKESFEGDFTESEDDEKDEEEDADDVKEGDEKDEDENGEDEDDVDESVDKSKIEDYVYGHLIKGSVSDDREAEINKSISKLKQKNGSFVDDKNLKDLASELTMTSKDLSKLLDKRFNESEEEDEDEDDETLEESFEVYIDQVLDLIYEMKDEDEDEEGEEDVEEGMRPKRLTGMAKKAREAKSQLMSLVKKDPEIKSIIDRTKKKIIQKAKALGKKNGIKVQRVDFTKIKL